MRIKIEEGSREWDSITRSIILPRDKKLSGIEIEVDEIDWIKEYKEKRKQHEELIELLNKKIELMEQGYTVDELDGKTLKELQNKPKRKNAKRA